MIVKEQFLIPQNMLFNLSRIKIRGKESIGSCKVEKPVSSFFWVKFDEPQMDGDGPCLEGEVEAECIYLIQ